jgi:hypothetical protein
LPTPAAPTKASTSGRAMFFESLGDGAIVTLSPSMRAAASKA